MPRARVIAMVGMLAAVACGGRNLPDDGRPTPTEIDAGSDDTGGPVMAKANEIDLVIEGSEVSISDTNEVGSVELQKVDSFLGACEKLSAPEGAIWLVDCLQEGTGVRLKFVHRPPNLVVLSAKVDPSNPNPGFDEFEVFTELPLPQGGHLRINP